ncbi:hypothetical protein N9Y89_01215 [bacterium]|jgi:hypothetical protein|nr:hypothetical protein [bacterium]
MGKSIDLAVKPEKITDEQLKELQGVISGTNQIKIELGNMEAQKHILLHRLDAVNKQLTDIQVKLEEEYGKIDLDINTGVIKYPEDEQADS